MLQSLPGGSGLKVHLCICEFNMDLKLVQGASFRFCVILTQSLCGG